MPASRKDAILQATYGSDQYGISTYECDITSETSVGAVFRQIAFHVSFNDIFPSMLVNTVDYISVAPLQDISQANITKTITTNLIGPLIVSIAFAELYSELAEYTKQQLTVITPPGRIVSISSKAAHTSLGGYGAYCASKAGLNSLTRCMAKEWGDKGIISNIISSNTARVPLEERARVDRESSDDTLTAVPESQASETLANANAIVSLCQNEKETINGTEIEVIHGAHRFVGAGE